jgi:hypothetical protein
MASFCGDCETVSDNNTNMCRPRMSDGRHFTDYKPRCAVNMNIVNGNVMTSYEFRQYMIDNADIIMQKNRENAINTNRCGPCVEPWNQGTMLPEQSTLKCDNSVCSININDPYGLGQGRDYGIKVDAEYINFMSEKNAEMSRNPKNCCLTPDDKIQYYPLCTTEESYVERPSIPGGGYPFPTKW